MTVTVHASVHVPVDVQPRAYIDEHGNPVIRLGDVPVFIGTGLDAADDRVSALRRLSIAFDELSDEVNLLVITAAGQIGGQPC